MRIVLVTVIAIFIFGFIGNTKAELEKEIADLKQQIAWQDKTIEKLLEQNREVLKVREKFEKIRPILQPLLTKLQNIDKQMYNGKFVMEIINRSPEPTVEEINQGYINLINHIEKELYKNI